MIIIPPHVGIFLWKFLEEHADYAILKSIKVQGASNKAVSVKTFFLLPYIYPNYKIYAFLCSLFSSIFSSN